MLAYAMNGEQLPLLNGFPLRLIVPVWYSTYWVKMLNDIEVLDQPDTQPAKSRGNLARVQPRSLHILPIVDPAVVLRTVGSRAC
jgi:DMSO/TMAO reductase YedYZ molybdopterin-dependent catalytic subunit